MIHINFTCSVLPHNQSIDVTGTMRLLLGDAMKLLKLSKFRLPLAAMVASAASLMASEAAHALPSFSRQTGEECAACHVGAFGPQLTPHGMKFKLEGYADGKSPSWYVPLSGQAVGGYTNTSKSQDGGAATHFSPNDNTALQEASVFVAGRLADGLGIFSQATYSGIDHTTGWDQFDLRYAHVVNIGGKDTIFGVSLNNNPTVQDSFNTLSVWTYPYTSSGLTPGYLGTPIIMDGISQQTLGLSVYTQWNDWIYLEGGAYRSLPHNFLRSMGLKSQDLIDMDGPAPYWRAAVSHSFNHQFASLGVFGLNASVIPDPSNPLPDKFHDVGIDGTYQFLGTRKHIFTLNSRYTREHRTLYGTYADGEGADSESGSVSEYNVNGSYYFRNTYGLTVSTFATHGNTDLTLYGEESATGSPNTQGMMYQVDYTPFGKEGSWMAPWANARVALQYTTYSKFNGSSSDYDGNGRNAADNNTLFAFLWLAW